MLSLNTRSNRLLTAGVTNADDVGGITTSQVDATPVILRQLLLSVCVMMVILHPLLRRAEEICFSLPGFR